MIIAGPQFLLYSQIIRALIGWKSGVGIHITKSKHRGDANAANFGSNKDKAVFDKFYVPALKISETKWNGIWLCSLEYLKVRERSIPTTAT